MKINYWKYIAFALTAILFWMLHFRERTIAQPRSEEDQMYKVVRVNDFGSSLISGNIMGFSCAADVHGDSGDISSNTECYVLTK